MATKVTTPLKTKPGSNELVATCTAGESFTTLPDGSTKGKGLAAEGLAFYQMLYAIEAKAKGLSWEKRFTCASKKPSPFGKR